MDLSSVGAWLILDPQRSDGGVVNTIEQAIQSNGEYNRNGELNSENPPRIWH